MTGAPRHLFRALRGCVRGACLMSGLWLAGAAAAQSSSCVPGDGAHIRQVCLERKRDAPRYGHDILGETPEWIALQVYWGPEGRARQDGRGDVSPYGLADHIFEDIAPRLVDLNGDGLLDIVTVQSSFSKGARLLAITTDGPLKVLPTPYIGQRNRWLAPVGAADLDGDGAIEIAFVDRPHLAKTLRVWRFTDAGLREIGKLPDVTNHRIGWDYIIGGMRDCGAGPEMVVASADWSDLLAVRFDGGFSTSKLGRYSRDAAQTALGCP